MELKEADMNEIVTLVSYLILARRSHVLHLWTAILIVLLFLVSTGTSRRKLCTFSDKTTRPEIVGRLRNTQILGAMRLLLAVSSGTTATAHWMISPPPPPASSVQSALPRRKARLPCPHVPNSDAKQHR